MDAFGHVRMEQGDSLYLFGDTLYYDGNSGLARLRNNVRLIHNDVILYTDHLNYDRFLNEAHFLHEGVIVNPDNHLRSVVGWYYPNSKTALFLDDVQLRHYDYADGVPEGNIDMQADYYTEDELAALSEVVSSDSTHSVVPMEGAHAALRVHELDSLSSPHSLADTTVLAIASDSLLVSDTLIASVSTSPHDRANLSIQIPFVMT